MVNVSSTIKTITMEPLSTLITNLFNKHKKHWSVACIPPVIILLIPAYRRWGTLNFNINVNDSYTDAELWSRFVNDVSSMSIHIIFFIAAGWGAMCCWDEARKQLESQQSLWKAFALRLATFLLLFFACGFASWYMKEYGGNTRDESLPLRWLGAAFTTVMLVIFMVDFLLANAGKKTLNRTACMSAVIISLLLGGIGTIAEIHHKEVYSKDRLSVIHMTNGELKMNVTVIDMTEKKLLVYDHSREQSEELYRSSVDYYFETIKNGTPRKVYVNPN